MKKLLALALMAVALTGCVNKDSERSRVTDVYVQFKNKQCTKADLDESTSKYYCKDGSTMTIAHGVIYTHIEWTSPDRINKYGGSYTLPMASDIRW